MKKYDCTPFTMMRWQADPEGFVLQLGGFGIKACDWLRGVPPPLIFTFSIKKKKKKHFLHLFFSSFFFPYIFHLSQPLPDNLFFFAKTTVLFTILNLLNLSFYKNYTARDV